jgi:hypothetical protein
LGWDWFVEFPRPQPALPADEQPPPLKALVQVKSTTGRPVSRIKLTNALRFANDPLPCFIVLYRYVKSNAPEIYVKHFWIDLIEIVLRRARLAHAEGVEHLNKIEVDIRFGQEDRVTRNVAQEVLKLASSVGSDYEGLKRKRSREIGFEREPIIGEITFGSGVTEAELAEMQVGLRDSVSISRLELRTNRFGIPARTPYFEKIGGKVAIRSTPSSSQTVFTSRRPRRSIQFPSQLYLAGPPLSKEHWRVRATFEFGETVWNFADATANFTFSWNTADGIGIEGLIRLVRLASMLSHGRLEMEVRGGPAKMQGEDVIVDPSTLGAGWASLDRFLYPFSSVVESISIERVYAVSDFADQMRDIEKYNSLLGPEEITLNTTLLDAVSPKDLDQGILAYGAGLEVKGTLFWSVAVRRLRSVEAAGLHVKLRFGPPEHRHDAIYEGNFTENEGEIAETVEALRDHAGAGALIALLPNAMAVPVNKMPPV